jgi:hypothetical protein
MKPAFYFLVLISMLACKSENATSYQIIDFEEAISNSEAFDITKHVSDIRYVPLETNENCYLADVRKVVMNEDFIMVSDSEGNLFQFTSSGQFIRRIGMLGKGPGEYTYMTDFVVDHSFQNIYINSLGFLYNYDADGKFNSRLPLSSGNLQVMCIDSRNRLFYIMPDVKQAKDKTSFDIVYVYDVNGHLLKTIESNIVRTEGLAMFNNIYEKNDEIFYKEEFGKSICRINAGLQVDTAFQIDLGKFAFEPEDLNMSKKDTWEDHYRMYNMLGFDRYVIFNLQKGLMGANTEATIYDRKKQDLIYPHYVDDSSLKGMYLDGAKLTPVSDFNEQLVCTVSPADIMEHRDKLTGDLKVISNQIDANSNPVLAILDMK